MIVSQKKILIKTRIEDLENDKFILDSLIPDSSGEILICRRDHLDRINYQIELANELLSMYNGLGDNEEIITDVHNGNLITLK